MKSNGLVLVLAGAAAIGFFLLKGNSSAAASNQFANWTDQQLFNFIYNTPEARPADIAAALAEYNRRQTKAKAAFGAISVKIGP